MDAVEKTMEQTPQVAELKPEDQQRVQEIVNSVNIQDAQSVIQYAVGAQRNISSFSDTVLEKIRAKDAGQAGQIISDLMIAVKRTEVDEFLDKIPILGTLSGRFKKFKASFDKMSVQIDKILDELEKSRIQLITDITLFDNLYQRNLEYMKELDLYIIAGKIKIKELREKTIPAMQEKARTSGDPVDAQNANDVAQLADQFEKKVYDLQLSRMISIQTGPQIRLIQKNDSVLVDKIQSSILNTIPLWKNQVVIAIGLYNQQQALDKQKMVTKTTNELLAKNSELLKMGTLETAKESERGIVELETLKKVNNDLMTTLEESVKIQEEGRKKRAEAEIELKALENQLKAKLADMASRNTATGTGTTPPPNITPLR